MRTRTLALAIAILAIALFLSPSASADNEDLIVRNLLSNNTLTWGVIHCHSNFSDGVCTIDEVAFLAKNHGAKFLVVTDHFEDISISNEDYDDIGNSFVEGLRYVRQIEKLSGIEKYIRACRDATDRAGILVVPGIEVGIGNNRDWVYDPAGGDNWDNMIHMLGIGAIDPETANLIDAALGHINDKTYSREEKTRRLDDTQNEIARIMDEAGLAVVIAHPYMADIVHGFHYTIYKNKLDHVHGIEFFNGSGNYDEKSLEAIGFLKRDVAMGPYTRNLAVTAGCDFHGIPGTGGEELFDKQTAIATELPFYWSGVGYAAACRTVADTLRGEGLVVACVKPGTVATIVDTVGRAVTTGSVFGTGIYQNGEKQVNGLNITSDKLDPSEPYYLHIPGLMIIRSSSPNENQPQEYSHNRNRDRYRSDHDLGGLVTIDTRDTSAISPTSKSSEQSATSGSTSSRTQREFPYPFPAGNWRVERPEVPNIKHKFTIGPGGSFSSMFGPLSIGKSVIMTVFAHNGQLEWHQLVSDFYNGQLLENNRLDMKILSINDNDKRTWRVKVFDPEDNETREYFYSPEWDNAINDYKKVEVLNPYNLNSSVRSIPPPFPAGYWEPLQRFGGMTCYDLFGVDNASLITSSKGPNFIQGPCVRYLTSRGNKLIWRLTWPKDKEAKDETREWTILSVDDSDTRQWVVKVYCPEEGLVREYYYYSAAYPDSIKSLKQIHVKLNSDKPVVLFLAWHDCDGWHNEDFSSGWKLSPTGKETVLCDKDIRIRADTIMYWAMTEDDSRRWNYGNGRERYPIAIHPNIDYHLLTF